MLDVIKKRYDFLGHQRPPVVASAESGVWRKKITGAAPPTVQSNSGTMELALTATSEAQITTLYWGDDLGIAIDDLIQVDFMARVSASLNAAVDVGFGVAAAQNDTLGSIAQYALWRLDGTNNVTVDTKDGTTTNTGLATGQTLVNTFKRFSINFGEGVQTRQPGVSKGGKAAVTFSMEDGRGNLRRVLADTLIDMSGYAGNLQLFAQNQKSSGTATGTFGIRWIEVTYRI